MLTTAAGADMDGIHHRMPVIVPRDRWSVWLDRTTDPRSLDVVAPAPPGTLLHHPVSTRVNRVDADDPSLVEPYPG